MKGFRSRISAHAAFEEIRVRFADSPPPQAVLRKIPIQAASGCVLAEEVIADCDVPGFDRSAMDGWAVRGEDTFGASAYNPLALSVIGEAFAGSPTPKEIESGQAIRIMTGAPLPGGADAVLPAEAGKEVDGTLQVREAVPPERHVSRRGEDVRAGCVLLEAGRRLRPQDIACAAATGKDQTVVFLPRVALVITGEELIPIEGGAELGFGQIHDVNSILLDPLIRRDGGEVVAVHRCGDEREELQTTLSAATEQADLVIVSGASSVGVKDFVPSIVETEGELVFHGVAMRPSSPTGFGLLNNTPTFLLPGNPVSCFCAYDFFTGPAIRLWAGRSASSPYPLLQCRLTRKIVSELGRLDYVRVQVSGNPTEDRSVEPVATSGASILSSTVRALGFVLVPEGLEGYSEGEEILVSLYDLETGDLA